MEAGKVAKIFQDSDCTPWTAQHCAIEANAERLQLTMIVSTCNVDNVDLHEHLRWKEQMQLGVQKGN